MKRKIYFLTTVALLAMLFFACKKTTTSVPTVTSSTVTATSATTASAGGTVITEGTTPVIARGTCWSKIANPTIADSKTSDGTGTGTFTSSIAGLTPATAYHVRAYATNGNGTGYGEDKTLTTGSQIKSISFYAAWAGGTEEWDVTYDANGKVTKIDDMWEGSLDKTLNFDYTVAGKLTVTKASDGSVNGTYTLDSSGHITKDDWGSGEYASYDYNANGFLTNGHEYWSSADHMKYQLDYVDNSVTQITTFGDDGVTAKKIKTFVYTIGDNVNGIPQAINDITGSEYKALGNLFGKPSMKLVDHFDYWDPRVSPIVKKTSTYTYKFDSSNRVTQADKFLSADSSTETWKYTYAN
ncbi:MAG: DUF4595 domain-containing protein [Mariniphaga sp.]